MPNGFENVALACREFVAIIEAIRIQRQREAKQRPRRDLQRFSQEELCDLGYGAYKDILKSKVRYPPRKAIVTRIADYLEATPQQRNALLLAAKCAPDQINLTEDELRLAIKQAKATIDYLPHPSFVMTRDWCIHEFNSHLMALFDIKADEFRNIPLLERNALRFIFDPKGPIRDRIHPTSEQWKYVAYRNLYIFKLTNALCDNEEWYQALVESFKSLPHFAACWGEIPRFPRFDPSCSAIDLITSIGSIRIRPTIASITNIAYPVIVSYVPADDTSRRAFATLGLPTPENGWAARRKGAFSP